MNGENKAWTIAAGFLAMVILTLIVTVAVHDISRNNRALENGLQQCQKIGANGTVWQRECD